MKQLTITAAILAALAYAAQPSAGNYGNYGNYGAPGAPGAAGNVSRNLDTGVLEYRRSYGRNTLIIGNGVRYDTGPDATGRRWRLYGK